MNITEAAPLEAETFKLGKKGWAVIACQDALNSHFARPVLVLDGDFGPMTDSVAKQVQKALGIAEDGIVGPETQRAFVRAKCKHAELHATPPGLLAGSCDIESSYEWACVSILNSNGTHDVGCTQQSLHWPASEAQLLAAFNPDSAAHVLAGEFVGFHKAVAGKVTSQRAWELAALNHNWPSAAWAIARHEDGWLSQPEDWLTKKGFANGWAFVDFYIQKATAQVTSWIVV